MIFGLQVAGFFVAIAAALVFTAWAETWIVSSGIGQRGPAQPEVMDRELIGSERLMSRAA